LEKKKTAQGAYKRFTLGHKKEASRFWRKKGEAARNTCNKGEKHMREENHFTD